MSNLSFTSTPNPVNPAATQSPFPNWVTNPIGSEYAAQYGHSSTLHLRRVIYEKIVDSIPAQFGILKVLFDKETIYRPSDEHTWTERLVARPLLVASANVGGGATQAIVLTAGGSGHVSINDIIVYPNNTHGIIREINAATNTITVHPYNGAANLPAVTAADEFIIEAAPVADGMNTFVHYDRMQTIEYTNYITMGRRNKRWTTMTALKYQSTGTTDYFEKDFNEMWELAMQDMLALFINGQKGEVNITAPADALLTAGNYLGKMNWGVFPFMQQNGAMHSTSSPATLEADFKTLAFETNYMNVNAPRFILGTDKALNALSTIWKDPVRYAPNDTISSLDLMEYRMGTMRFVPIVMPHFQRNAYMFPSIFENRLLVVDFNSISPVCVQNYEPITMTNTKSQTMQQGGYNDFVDYTCHYMMGLQFTTVQGSFWIDLINI